MHIEENEKQLSHGIWVFKDGYSGWGDKVNDNFKALNDLMVKNTLTIKQGEEVLGVFNNTEDVTIEIPASNTQSSESSEPEELTKVTEEYIPLYVCIDTDIAELSETTGDYIFEGPQSEAVIELAKELNTVFKRSDKLADLIYLKKNSWSNELADNKATFVKNIEKDGKTYAMFALNTLAKGSEYGIAIYSKPKQYVYDDVVNDSLSDESLTISKIGTVQYEDYIQYSESYVYNNRLFIKMVLTNAIEVRDQQLNGDIDNIDYYDMTLVDADSYFEKFTFEV